MVMMEKDMVVSTADFPGFSPDGEASYVLDEETRMVKKKKKKKKSSSSHNSSSNFDSSGNLISVTIKKSRKSKTSSVTSTLTSGTFPTSSNSLLIITPTSEELVPKSQADLDDQLDKRKKKKGKKSKKSKSSSALGLADSKSTFSSYNLPSFPIGSGPSTQQHYHQQQQYQLASTGNHKQDSRVHSYRRASSQMSVISDITMDYALRSDGGNHNKSNNKSNNSSITHHTNHNSGSASKSQHSTQIRTLGMRRISMTAAFATISEEWDNDANNDPWSSFRKSTSVMDKNADWTISQRKNWGSNDDHQLQLQRSKRQLIENGDPSGGDSSRIPTKPQHQLLKRSFEDDGLVGTKEPPKRPSGGEGAIEISTRSNSDEGLRGHRRPPARLHGGAIESIDNADDGKNGIFLSKEQQPRFQNQQQQQENEWFGNENNKDLFAAERKPESRYPQSQESSVIAHDNGGGSINLLSSDIQISPRPSIDNFKPEISPLTQPFADEDIFPMFSPRLRQSPKPQMIPDSSNGTSNNTGEEQKENADGKVDNGMTLEESVSTFVAKTKSFVDGFLAPLVDNSSSKMEKKDETKDDDDDDDDDAKPSFQRKESNTSDCSSVFSHDDKAPEEGTTEEKEQTRSHDLPPIGVGSLLEEESVVGFSAVRGKSDDDATLVSKSHLYTPPTEGDLNEWALMTHAEEPGEEEEKIEESFEEDSENEDDIGAEGEDGMNVKMTLSDLQRSDADAADERWNGLNSKSQRSDHSRAAAASIAINSRSSQSQNQSRTSSSKQSKSSRKSSSSSSSSNNNNNGNGNENENILRRQPKKKKRHIDSILRRADNNAMTDTDDSNDIAQTPITKDDPRAHDLLVMYLESKGTPKKTAEAIASDFVKHHGGFLEDETESVEDVAERGLARHYAEAAQKEQRAVISNQTPHHSSHGIDSGPTRQPMGRDTSRSVRVHAPSNASVRMVDERSVARNNRGRTWTRAEEPGAVQMEGRAFGAPERPPAADPQTDSFADMGRQAGDHLIEAQAVGEFGFIDDISSHSMPLVYAESSPMSLKHLMKESIVRKFVFGGCAVVLLVVVLVIVGVTRGGRGDSSRAPALPNGATLPPSTPPTLIIDVVLDQARVLSGGIVDVEGSPQRRAVGWMSTFDNIDTMDGFGPAFSQRYALVTLFYSTNGESWLEREQWLNPSLHECDWTSSITCKEDLSGRSTVVVEIDMTRNGLTGELPQEISLLSQMEVLVLSRNKISGLMPQKICNMTKLTRMDLSHNELSGEIPADIGSISDLGHLDFSFNQFQGTLPYSFSGLQFLRVVELSHNMFSGTISTEIAKLTSLSSFNMQSNLLAGKIPDFASDALPSFDFINFGDNLLTGTLPVWILSLVTRQEITISHNMLSGVIPLPSSDSGGFDLILQTGDTSPIRIRKVDLSYNNFEGPLPTWAHLLPTLQVVDLSNNRFEGGIPFFPGSPGWVALKYINLSNNRLQGTFPEYLPPNLEFMDVSGNQITGALPLDVCQASSLRSVFVQGNPVGTDVNIFLECAHHLVELTASDCGLTGKLLPDSLGKLSNIELLSLASNQIWGTVPTEIGQLSLLKKLGLRDNNLSGTIPSEIGLLSDLSVLHLNNNNFVSSLPQEIGHLSALEVLTLSGNPMLDGDLPPALCQVMRNLTRGDIGCELGCTCCADTEGLCPAKATARQNVFLRGDPN